MKSRGSLVAAATVLLGCSVGTAPNPGTYEPWAPAAGAAGMAQVATDGSSSSAGSVAVGGDGATQELGGSGGSESGTGGTAQAGDGGTTGEAGGLGAVGGGSNLGGAPQVGSGGSGAAGHATGVSGMPSAGGAPAGGVGGSAAGQGAGGSAGKIGAAGSGPVDQCASMPGKLLASYPATNAKIDGGSSSAAPSTTTHSLRVWFSSPAGYCDETFGGSTPPAVTLNNNQTGNFALPGANLCFNGNATGEIHIDPAGGFARVNGMGTTWTVQGICVRVRRNHWDVQFHVNGDVDETWELWGTP